LDPADSIRYYDLPDEVTNPTNPAARKIIPSPAVAASGHNAADVGWLRIIKSLNACMVHVVGIHCASSRIHPGSKSSGHQHPPIAAIAMLTVTPSGITES
jgi:hypothetical protein